MKNEELKQQAIRNAWVAEIGNDDYQKAKVSITKDGLLELDQSFVDREWPNLERVEWINGYEGRVGLYRPKSLSGIETLHGWTRIEPDGSNLPHIRSKEKFFVGKMVDGLFEQKQQMVGVHHLVRNLLDGTYSHYQKVEQPKPPHY